MLLQHENTSFYFLDELEDFLKQFSRFQLKLWMVSLCCTISSISIHFKNRVLQFRLSYHVFVNLRFLYFTVIKCKIVM